MPSSNTSSLTAEGSASTPLWLRFIPVMLCFFAMGFVDLVGTASNYVQKDLNLSEAQTYFIPSLVFFWFLIFAVPTGMLMNRIGRKRTVLVSLVITAISLGLPLCGSSYAIMLTAFSLLGIGNAVMQTSLNPLVTNIIGTHKLAATLTLGQFVKAIASFLAPIIAAWGAVTLMATTSLGWKVLFVIYGIVSLLAVGVLAPTPIHEDKPDKATGFAGCLKMLGTPFIFLCFLGIICHVGIDVGTNTTAPKIIMERLALPLEEASFATGVYFIFRTIGCFTGAFLLRWVQPRWFLAISVAMMAAAVVVLFSAHSLMAIYTGIALIGYGNSNVFSIVFSQALTNKPEQKNEVSGLMIMGLFGGTIFPFAMGIAADALGQAGAVAVMSLGVVYLALYSLKLCLRRA